MDMDPQQRQIRVRLLMIFLFSLIFLLFSFRNNNVDNVEELRRQKYGDTVIEIIQDASKANETSNPLLRIHLFKLPEDSDSLRQRFQPNHQPENHREKRGLENKEEKNF